MRHITQWMLVAMVAVLAAGVAALVAGPASAQEDDLEGVAAIVDVLFTEDEEAIRDLIGYSQFACEAEPIGPGSGPMCLAGEEEGTLVDALPVVHCEGGPVREEDIDDIVESLAAPGPDFVAVYVAPDDEEQYLGGAFVALYTGWYEGSSDRVLGVWMTDGLITGLGGGCGENAADFVSLYGLGPELDLPGTGGPGLPSTGYGVGDTASRFQLWIFALAIAGLLLVSGGVFAAARVRRG